MVESTDKEVKEHHGFIKKFFKVHGEIFHK